MPTRTRPAAGVHLKAVTAVAALSNGDFVISGETELGQIEVSFPGHSAKTIGAGVAALCGQVNERDESGRALIFQAVDIAVRASPYPNQVQLLITVAPDVELAFAMSTIQLERAARGLLAAARTVEVLSGGAELEAH